MSTQPPLAVCVSSWFVGNVVAAIHRSWCSVFIPALQLNKWGPIRCFSPWMGCCYQHSICPTHSTTAASPRMYLWIFESDFTVIQMWKCFENENTYSKVFIEPPHQTHSSVFCSITYSWLFFFFLRGLTSSGVNVTVSPPSTVDFLCFGISLSAEEGSGSARPILDFVPCSSLDIN